MMAMAAEKVTVMEPKEESEVWAAAPTAAATLEEAEDQRAAEEAPEAHIQPPQRQPGTGFDPSA